MTECGLRRFVDEGICVNALEASNCGYHYSWSDYFIKKIDRAPLKNITLRVGNYKHRGELLITPYGIEGSSVYGLGHYIRDEIRSKGSSRLTIDFKPDLSIDEIKKRLASKDKSLSLSSFLKRN